jgi:Leucine-rich repeat (LRR) protein
VSLRSFNF